MLKKELKECAWSQRDETNFINGLGTHTDNKANDLATIETLLNRYRIALCKRQNMAVGFSISGAIQLVDRRLNDVREIRSRPESNRVVAR